MNISDMIDFVNKISSVDLEKLRDEDSVPMSEIREDKVSTDPSQMKKQVAVSKVEGV